MKISVLIDNYNYGRYVGEAMQSVLDQTYPDFELVVVDDGSTDDSRNVIASFTDSRIKPVFKENGGQASAFNAGFEQCTGEYVAFLDADDLFDPRKLERCVDVLKTEPDIVLLNHALRTIDDAGQHIGTTNFSTSGHYDVLPDLRKFKTHLQLVPTSFFLGRRKECLELCIDEEMWRIAADKPLIVGLALRGKIFNINEVLGSYRSHGANDSHGQFTDDLAFSHHLRFYEAVNDELRRLGSTEQFDFRRSDFAIDHTIVRSSRYMPKGAYFRLRKLLRKIRRSRETSIENI